MRLGHDDDDDDDVPRPKNESGDGVCWMIWFILMLENDATPFMERMAMAMQAERCWNEVMVDVLSVAVAMVQSAKNNIMKAVARRPAIISTQPSKHQARDSTWNNSLRTDEFYILLTQRFS